MSALPEPVQAFIAIFIVVMAFNVFIFVHELGHFLAARWRGLYVDRFQIWFGKPIWKKTIHGVQYGLGSIPAGGFVSLPQMAPMEMLEGSEINGGKPLPPISPLDKIIVAFAGPLFSMLLALACATAVWQVGKPKEIIGTNEIGYVVPDKPAAKAGLRPGDRVLAINGQPVHGFSGSLDSITERIVLSRGEQIRFTIERPGNPGSLDISSTFETDQTKWYQRRGLRSVGIEAAGPAVVGGLITNSPAAKAGLQVGDRISTMNGQPLLSTMQLSQQLKDSGWAPARLGITASDGSTREVTLAPAKPLQPADSNPMLGISWDFDAGITKGLVKPTPFEQIRESARMMWITITSIIAPDTSIGIDQLSGPIGIGRMQYILFLLDDGWRRLLAFAVLLNVNLAILNMLPFPVLDGGHIVLAILEKISGRAVRARPLEIVQTACAFALIGLMLFVTSKDIGDMIGGGKRGEVVFPAD